jgi:hypothetical protein
MAVAVALGVASVIFISWLLEKRELGAAARWGLALIPVAAYVFCLVSYLRLIRLAAARLVDLKIEDIFQPDEDEAKEGAASSDKK